MSRLIAAQNLRPQLLANLVATHLYYTCYKVSSQPGKWLTFYQVAEWSNSLTHTLEVTFWITSWWWSITLLGGAVWAHSEVK